MNTGAMSSHPFWVRTQGRPFTIQAPVAAGELIPIRSGPRHFRGGFTPPCGDPADAGSPLRHQTDPLPGFPGSLIPKHSAAMRGMSTAIPVEILCINKKDEVLTIGCCPNFGYSAGFQPAKSRQDGGATFKLGQHPKSRQFVELFKAPKGILNDGSGPQGSSTKVGVSGRNAL